MYNPRLPVTHPSYARRSPSPYGKTTHPPSTAPKRTAAPPVARNFHNTMATKVNLTPGSSRTAYFTAATTAVSMGGSVLRSFLVDEGTDGLHALADSARSGSHRPTEDKREDTGIKTASVGNEEAMVSLHHVHRTISDEGKSSALPESEKVRLNVIEGGEKRVFLAKIEYLRELDPDEFGEDALLLGEASHEHHGGEAEHMK